MTMHRLFLGRLSAGLLAALTVTCLPHAGRTPKRYRPGKVRDQVSYKDVTSVTHWASLEDASAAAKVFLDRKNDSGECDSSHVIVVGAESGGTLGAMWIYSEWQRHRT